MTMDSREIRAMVDSHLREYDAKFDKMEHSILRIEHMVGDLYGKWNKALISILGVLFMLVVSLMGYIWAVSTTGISLP